MNLRRHILLFHNGALGDFLITFPLAMAISRIFAQNRISYITHASKGKLAEKLIGVESVDSEMGWHGLFAVEPKLPENCLKLLRGAQMVITFIAKPGDTWTKNVETIGEVPIVHHLDTNQINPGEHITDALARQLPNGLGDAMTQMTRSIRSRGLGVKLSPGHELVIHPGAGSPGKCWPVENFIELLARRKGKGLASRILLGEVERDRWGAAQIGKLGSLARINQPANYLELFGELSTAQSFLGNDSGPGHLAAMIGVPTVTIFGSDATTWRPIGPRAEVVEAKSIDQVTVEQVEQACRA